MLGRATRTRRMTGRESGFLIVTGSPTATSYSTGQPGIPIQRNILTSKLKFAVPRGIPRTYRKNLLGYT